MSDDAHNAHYFRTDHLKADLGSRTARGGVLIAASQGIKFCIGLGGTVILARLLTPVDFGLIGMVAIVFNFVSMFQYLGLSTATIKWSDLNHQQVSTLFWLNVALSVAIMLVTVGSAPVVAWFYKEPRLLWITAGYAVSILFAGLYIQHEAILSRQMRFAAIAVIEIAGLSIGLIAAVVAAWCGAAYWSLVLNQLVMTLVTVAGVWIACKWRPGLPSRRAGIRSMLAYGGNLTGFNVATFFARNLDNALIGKFWGAYQLGVYARAYQMLFMPIQQINAPLVAVVVPALSRLADSPERYRTAYLRILEKIAMITMPGVAFMIATSDWLVLFLLGPHWHEAGRIFALLGLAAIIQPVTRTVLWLFTTQGRAREIFKWGVMGGIIAVVSIVAGLPWGATGVATSYAVADLCISTPLLFWYVGRRGPVRTRDLYRTIAPAACASVCSLFVLLVCHQWLEVFPQTIMRLVIAFGITMIVSFGVLAAIPAGRLAMQNLKEMLLLFFKEKRGAVV